MIRTVVIDDEERSREAITTMVKLFTDNDIDIVGYGKDVKSGIQAIEKYGPQLVFLDIKMSDGTGFDLLEKIDNIDFDVVFITAYDEFAITAFKYSAIDYILKPVDPDKFVEVINKLKKKSQKDDIGRKLEVLVSNIHQPVKEEKKIVLKTSNNIHVIKVKDIIRCESDRNYTRFYIKNENPILVSKSLKSFVDTLEDFGFFRVHQSYLINLNYAKCFVKDECTCVMDDGTSIPVSTRKRDLLLKRFEEL